MQILQLGLLSMPSSIVANSVTKVAVSTPAGKNCAVGKDIEGAGYKSQRRGKVASQSGNKPFAYASI